MDPETLKSGVMSTPSTCSYADNFGLEASDAHLPPECESVNSRRSHRLAGTQPGVSDRTQERWTGKLRYLPHRRSVVNRFGVSCWPLP
jgi:hypothetical protein